MKKKILIAVAAVMVVIIGVIAFTVVSDINQEKKLRAELEEINALTAAQPIDMDAINEKLDKIVTKGDYAQVEDAAKTYLKESFDNTLKISQLISDERITNILTVENYLEDGKEFTETKQYIQNTKSQLEECKAKYSEFLTREKAMSYINSKNLDSYYVDFYEDEFVGDIESENDDKTVENAIDDIISLLDVSGEAIDLLADNPGAWEIEGENIVFSDDGISAEYDSILSSIS